jgi:SAM-dependent methyltransferase
LKNLLSLVEQFGAIDIYLFDQLLRGRIAPGMRILDAGCGSGRNLVYFLRAGYEVFGVDMDPEAVESTRELVKPLCPRRCALRCDSPRYLARAEARRDAVLPACFVHRNRIADQASIRAPLLVTGWFRKVFGRRAATNEHHKPVGRGIAGPVEDNGGARTAVDDDLGYAANGDKMKRTGLLTLALALAGTQSACIVVGGYGRRGGGWFLWPGGLGGILIILLIIMLLRRR